MAEERICNLCGRANPLTQPRCIGCGERARGSVLLAADSEDATVKSTPWWHGSTTPVGSVPVPPQVKTELERAEAERRVAEERAAEDARRREEAARRVAAAREALETQKAVPSRGWPKVATADTVAATPAAAPRTAAVSVACHQCGATNAPGFSFCLCCGADAAAPAASAQQRIAARAVEVNARVSDIHARAADLNARAADLNARAAEINAHAARTVGTSQAAPTAGTFGGVSTAVGVSVTTTDPGAVEKSHASPGLAAALSFVIPGIGQILNGQTTKGVLLLLALFAALTVFGWQAWGIAMVVGRVIAALDAYRIAERKRSGDPVRDNEWDLG